MYYVADKVKRKLNDRIGFQSKVQCSPCVTAAVGR
jgi:hypothetical protein